MEFLNHLDWAAILKIVGIDIMLGVDNAIVIALACAALPAAMRTKAVFWGTAGAVILRIILLAFASLLIGLTWVKLIAGLYLVYIGYKLLAASEDSHDINPATNIWGAIQTIIIADFMMSLDNVLAVTGAAQSAGEHSMVYAIAGVLLSIPIIVYGAQGIMKLMDKYPIIIWLGAGLLGWVGVEMILTDAVIAHSTVAQTFDAKFGDIWHWVAKSLGFLLVVTTVWVKEKIEDSAGV